MTDDERSRTTEREIVPPASTGAGVTLPEAASAYYSPRPLPVATPHATIETEAVRINPPRDESLPDTGKLNESGTPPWVAEPAAPRVSSNAPTVLVPAVRARRRDRALLAGLGVAALVGMLAVAVLRMTKSAGVPAVPKDSAQLSPAAADRTAVTGNEPAPRATPARASSAPPVASELPRAEGAPSSSSAAGESGEAAVAPTERKVPPRGPTRPRPALPKAWLR